MIYVAAEAMKLGFENGHPDWCNLGQGQPEVGEMEGAPPRFTDFRVEPGDHAYGPVNGTRALREAIARHYDRLYRSGKRSQYTADNVTVASGGRLVLTRMFAALGGVRPGYQPDYTAYEDMLAYHPDRLSARALVTDEAEGFAVSPRGSRARSSAAICRPSCCRTRATRRAGCCARRSSRPTSSSRARAR